MFPKCIDHFGRKKRETKVKKKTNKEKPRKKKKEKWE